MLSSFVVSLTAPELIFGIGVVLLIVLMGLKLFNKLLIIGWILFSFFFIASIIIGLL